MTCIEPVHADRKQDACEHAGNNRGDQIGDRLRPAARDQGGGKREQRHDDRGNNQNGTGRNEADGAADLLSLLAEFGLGQINLVLEQLCELRQRIAEEMRNRPNFGFRVHDASPLEDPEL